MHFGLRTVQYRVRASEWSEPATFSFGTHGSQAGPMATVGSIVPVRGEDLEGAG